MGQPTQLTSRPAIPAPHSLPQDKRFNAGRDMFTNETSNAIATTATQFGIEPAALLAVAEVEAGGRAYALFEGRREPLIRFEGHYFDRRLVGDKRSRARRAALSAPEAGKIANPASQAARWRLLERAARIDRKAAYESVSWGLGQVMGAHWAWLGFANVDALVAEARAGVGGQARLMARYIVKAGLREALADRDWARFARGYNGPSYRKNRYDKKLAAAYARYAKNGTPAPKPTGEGTLRRGASGKAVADLQSALSAAGYPLAIDGRFGRLTAMALRRFQEHEGLPANGVADADTLAALRTRLSLGARLRRWWARIVTFLTHRN